MRACIWSEEGEPLEMATVKVVRARKKHACAECGDAIAPGDQYEHVRGLCDDLWFTHRTCARCLNVRTDYFDRWTYGTMRCDFEAEHGFDYTDGIPADFAPCQEAGTPYWRPVNEQEIGLEPMRVEEDR